MLPVVVFLLLSLLVVSPVLEMARVQAYAICVGTVLDVVELKNVLKQSSTMPVIH